MTLDSRIDALDTSLFDSIDSQTSEMDRRSLLLLQRCARSEGSYVYLEIGSHLGGTIQPHLQDPKCLRIYSVDKRPTQQPDERGIDARYPGNSTARMLANLATAFPAADIGKIMAFDQDSGDVDAANMDVKPNICFIDAEHTNNAAMRDFQFCLRVCRADSIIALHDAELLFDAIRAMKRFLDDTGVSHRAFKLGGTVYTFLLNRAASRYAEAVQPLSMDEGRFFAGARQSLLETRIRNGAIVGITVSRPSEVLTTTLLRDAEGGDD